MWLEEEQWGAWFDLGIAPRFVQAARATAFSALALAHVVGVNSLIWLILAAGKRVNKSFR
jgi:hypothetical protein